MASTFQENWTRQYLLMVETEWWWFVILIASTRGVLKFFKAISWSGCWSGRPGNRLGFLLLLHWTSTSEYSRRTSVMLHFPISIHTRTHNKEEFSDFKEFSHRSDITSSQADIHACFKTHPTSFQEALWNKRHVFPFFETQKNYSTRNEVRARAHDH